MSVAQHHRQRFNWEFYRVVGASILRTAISFIGIMWALSLVPETPDYTLWRPLTILVIGLAVYILLYRRQLKRVQNSRYPAVSAFEALILAAVMFLAVFAATYVMMSASDPASFSEPLDHFNAFYFALTVLATVGFGDITPVSSSARLVCMVQMAIDIGFIAVLVRSVSSAAKSSSAFRGSKANGTADASIADL